MANIILHQFQGISIGLNRKDGYVNATKLCVAYNIANGSNKQPSDWTKTKRAESYIAYVSSVRNILRTDLIVIKQGGEPDEQGTWIHPDLAIPFATWLSVECEYQVSEWIQDWSKSKHLQRYPEQLIGDVPKAPEIAAAEFINAAFDMFLSHVDPAIRAGNKIEAICV